MGLNLFNRWALLPLLLQLVVLLSPNAMMRSVTAGVAEVPDFWFEFIEPRQEDDVRVCNKDLWDDGNGGGWKNSGNYSKLQTYYTVCRDGLKQLKKDMAGRHGPVSDPAVWNFMCGVECPISDQMHLVRTTVPEHPSLSLSLS